MKLFKDEPPLTDKTEIPLTDEEESPITSFKLFCVCLFLRARCARVLHLPVVVTEPVADEMEALGVNELQCVAECVAE